MEIMAASLVCLALNSYQEARNEPIEGQLAVNMVVLNRAKIKHKSVCDIVFTPHMFSWTEAPMSRIYPKPWELSYSLAVVSLSYPDFTHGATYYHRCDMKPYWIVGLTYLGRWGSHCFYK